MVKGKIPQRFVIGKSTGDGNCLYNSVSILLFGEETKAELLRLSSVIHAIDHFGLYLKKVAIYTHSESDDNYNYTVTVFKEIKDVAMAHQFIAAVGSSDLVFVMKP